MKTQKVTLYIYTPSPYGDGQLRVSSQDMRPHGWALLATQEVELEIPDAPFEVAELAALQEELREAEAGGRAKVQSIRSRMAEVQKKLSEDRTDGNV